MSPKDNLLYIDSGEDEPNVTEGQASQLKDKLFKIKETGKVGRMGRNFLSSQCIETDYVFQEKKKQCSSTVQISRRRSIVDKIVVSKDGIERDEQNKNGSTSSCSETKSIKEQQSPKQAIHLESALKRKENMLFFQLQQDSEDDGEPDEIPVGQYQTSKTITHRGHNQEGQIMQTNQLSPSNGTTPIEKIPLSVFDLRTTNKFQFASEIIPKGYVLETTVLKSRNISNYLYPQFDVLFKNTETHIISGKKQTANLGSNYPMSVNPENFGHLKPRNYLGKLRSTSKQLVYNIFDDGSNPQNMRGNFKDKKRRSVMATLQLTLSKGPRNVEVYMLKEGVSYVSLLHYAHEEPNLKGLYQIEKNKQKIHYFKTRRPEWVKELSQYYLNFKGRVSQASVRNFILEDPSSDQEVMLFGKHEDNVYHMDISHPLTPRLALGIALAMFDVEN